MTNIGKKFGHANPKIMSTKDFHKLNDDISEKMAKIAPELVAQGLTYAEIEAFLMAEHELSQNAIYKRIENKHYKE